jgi:type IV pilus assembly protein PilW
MFVTHPQPSRARRAGFQAGFSLVELMIAITLGLLLLSALTAAFINSSRTRDELERASQQIENGRYAMQALSDDLRLAGFWGQFNIRAAAPPTPLTLPDPCIAAGTPANLIVLRDAIPLHIQGYDDANAATPAAIAALTCQDAASPPVRSLADWKAGTDVVIVRRASTCIKGATDCALSSAPYFQASLCNSITELASANWFDQFRLDTVDSNLDRKIKNCTTTQTDKRQFIVRIYFVANNDASGDGIPTLKRAELAGGSFSTVSIAPGIENLQLEYGIDTNADGAADSMSADPGSVANWSNVVAVKVNLLARAASPTLGYTDPKTYTLGMKADGTTANAVTPGGSYKRRVFQSEVRLYNPAGRRE